MSDRIVGGHFLVTQSEHDKLGELAERPPATSVGALVGGIPVKVIPDDGKLHDVGDGKVAIYSTILGAIVVMPSVPQWETIVPSRWVGSVSDA